MSEKLRECPFCGDSIDSPEGINQNDGSYAYMLQCCNCGLSMFDFTKVGLIKNWNTRHEQTVENICNKILKTQTVVTILPNYIGNQPYSRPVIFPEEVKKQYDNFVSENNGKPS